MLRSKALLRLQSHSQKMLSSSFQPALAHRLSQFQDHDIWSIFTPLAQKHGAVNLGQGFPNIPVAPFIQESVIEAAQSQDHQYVPTRGLPALREALVSFYSPLFGRSLNKDNEILVTTGANQGILTVFQAFLNPGDQVLLLEPYFDIYKPAIMMCDAVPVAVPLQFESPSLNHTNEAYPKADDCWKLNPAAIEAAITPRTKIMLINTPHNPTGKVYSLDELEILASIAKRHNLIVLSDEVYDQLTFHLPHERIACLDGMWERTVSVYSAGKMFGVTGWRVGWLVGPSSLLHGCHAAHARTLFCSSAILQSAIARMMHNAMKTDYFEETRKFYLARRDQLMRSLKNTGFIPILPSGGFFIMAMTDHFLPLPEMDREKWLVRENEAEDVQFCRWMTVLQGVTAIPPSCFYEPERTANSRTFARFCFAKTEETLNEAEKRFIKMKTDFSS